MKERSCCPPDTLCLFSDEESTVWSTTAATTYLLTVKPEAGLRSPGIMDANALTLKMKVVQQSAPLTIKVDDKAFTASPAIVPPSIVLDYSVTALAQTVDGQIDVGQDVVRVEVRMPLLLAMFAQKIQKIVGKEGNKLLLTKK